MTGDLERGILPTDMLAGQGDFVLTQRGAVALFLTLFVGGAPADDGLAADERGLVGNRAGRFDGGLDGLGIVAVHLGYHVPPIGLEPLRRIVEEPGGGIAVSADLTIDGDIVVVVKGDELTQSQDAGQGAGLVGDALHHAAVAEKRVSQVVDDRMAGLVEPGRQDFLGQGHPHRIGKALAEGTGGSLDPRGIAVLGVAGSLGVQLAELLQILHAQRIAGQMQQREEKHGAVTVGQHEAVAIHPLRVGRVVLHEIVPQHFGNIGHPHGGAGVTGVCFLGRIHAQGTDGIGEFST